MEHHFDEYYDKKLGGKKTPNTNTTVSKTPHYLEDRTTAFGRSYRSMKDLDEDYPDFLKQLTDHAVKQWMRNKKVRRERERTKEKQDGMQTEKTKEMNNKKKQSKGKEKNREKKSHSTREKARCTEMHPPMGLHTR